MIVAGRLIHEYIKNQRTLESLASKLGVSRQSVYNVLKQEPLSGDMIAKLLKETGFNFEKAFEVIDEKK